MSGAGGFYTPPHGDMWPQVRVDPRFAPSDETGARVEAKGLYAGEAPDESPAARSDVGQHGVEQATTDAASSQLLAGGHAPQPPGALGTGLPGRRFPPHVGRA